MQKDRKLWHLLEWLMQKVGSLLPQQDMQIMQKVTVQLQVEHGERMQKGMHPSQTGTQLMQKAISLLPPETTLIRKGNLQPPVDQQLMRRAMTHRLKDPGLTQKVRVLKRSNSVLTPKVQKQLLITRIN